MSSCPSLRRPRRTLGTLLGLALTLFAQVLPTNPAQAAPAGADGLVLILGAPGSMTAKVQGKLQGKAQGKTGDKTPPQTRMDIAKTAVSDLIRDLPTGLEVGLIAYGHRQKDDCRDVEELAPLGPPDRQALIAKIADLTPKGKRSIANAVKTLTEGLRGRTGETTVVLVSDGAERCGGDPCTLVKALKASGSPVVLHVVGLGVAAKERPQLACMAAAGGGTYVGAKNAADLGTALKKALAPTVDRAGRLSIKALRDGRPLGASYALYAEGTPRTPDQAPLAASPIADQGETIRLLPGTYDLVIKDTEDPGTPSLTFTGLRITAGETLEQVAEFQGGDLVVRALRNRRPVGAWFQVFRAGESAEGGQEPVATQTIGTEGATITLMPGTYDLVIKDTEDLGNPVRQFPGLVIEPGKTIQKTAEFTGGTIKVIARKGGRPVSARFEVFTPGTDGARPQSIATNPIDDEGERIRLPPGTYDLEVRNMEDEGNPVARFPGLVVEPGRTLEQRVDF